MSEDQVDVQVDAAPAVTAVKSKAVSKREKLNEKGELQDDWIGAGGFRYTVLDGGFELNVMWDELPVESQQALMAFGGLTLAGNTTNTVRNGENKGEATSEKDALLALVENLKAGNWTSPRGEVEAGPGLLAEAYVAAMAKTGVVLDLLEIAAKLKAATDEKRKEVRADARVALELKNILAARAAAKAANATGDIVSL